MQGLPLREGPNALAAMAARPLPPSGFSALMQRVRPGALMATASKALCPSPGAGFAVVNASSMMLTSFPVAGPARHGVLSGAGWAAGGVLFHGTGGDALGELALG